MDAVVIDPPYCSGGQTANARAQTPSSKYEQFSNAIVHHPNFVGYTMDKEYGCMGVSFVLLIVSVLLSWVSISLCLLIGDRWRRLQISASGWLDMTWPL